MLFVGCICRVRDQLGPDRQTLVGNDDLIINFVKLYGLFSSPLLFVICNNLCFSLAQIIHADYQLETIEIDHIMLSVSLLLSR